MARWLRSLFFCGSKHKKVVIVETQSMLQNSKNLEKRVGWLEEERAKKIDISSAWKKNETCEARDKPHAICRWRSKDKLPR